MYDNMDAKSGAVLDFAYFMLYKIIYTVNGIDN